ncbi:DUF3888 domain-containing protein [Sporolactobacillus sp. STCC-11]|uniref:DUF3888 domain-containing protein n=1 Tax=Sporolactobacillus caesalpiniae TaxID=3230362 RepID=UPI00339330A6
MEQVSDHLMVTLFDEQITSALTNYYKDDSIQVHYNWWDKKYDVVEVSQAEKGNVLPKPFVINFTILAYKNSKLLGIDTIKFGVTPRNGTKKSEPKVELLSYTHNLHKNK